MKKTGKPIEGFITGWAFIWPCRKVHNWIEHYHDPITNHHQHTAACSTTAITYRNKPALNGGSFPNCKHCERIND